MATEPLKVKTDAPKAEANQTENDLIAAKNAEEKFNTKKISLSIILSSSLRLISLK